MLSNGPGETYFVLLSCQLPRVFIHEDALYDFGVKCLRYFRSQVNFFMSRNDKSCSSRNNKYKKYNLSMVNKFQPLLYVQDAP